MRIILADDHDLVRESLAAAIERELPGAKVVGARTLAEALEAVAEAPAVLAILDLYMPGMNGLEGLEAMRRAAPATPIAVLSGMVRRDEALAALARGAAGFIPKTVGVRSLVGAIQVMLGGEYYIPSIVVGAAAPGPFATGAGTPLRVLTRRETDVLALLSKGLSNKEIAAQLTMKPITVASHLKSVFRKLGASNRTHAAKIALESGLGA